MENFISILFKNKEENEGFNIQDSELLEWEKRLENGKKELHNLLSEKLEEKYQARIDHIILEMEEVNRNIFDITKQIYYEIGVKDGEDISKTLNKE